MSPTRSERLRAAVVYEPWRNHCTEAIAHAVAEGLRDAGWEVQMRDVTTAWTAGLPAAGLLVVGAPTHSFSLTRPPNRADVPLLVGGTEADPVGLREVLTAWAGRQPADGRACATFDTRMRRIGHLPRSAATLSARMLTHHGYRLAARPAGFFIDDPRGPLTAGEPQRARSWGTGLAHAVAMLDDPLAHRAALTEGAVPHDHAAGWQ